MIDYMCEDYVDVIMWEMGGCGVDVVFDIIGGYMLLCSVDVFV